MNDDSFQTFIYVLAVVGAVVLSVMKSYRKARQQQAGTPFPAGREPWQEEGEAPSFDEMARQEEWEEPSLEEMARQFTHPVVPARPASRPEARPDIDLARYQEVTKQRQQEQERDRKIERDRRFAALFRDNELRQTPGEEKKNEFNLKEAIIYSELLNRKYE
jgi:hypothetical protein